MEDGSDEKSKKRYGNSNSGGSGGGNVPQYKKSHFPQYHEQQQTLNQYPPKSKHYDYYEGYKDSHHYNYNEYDSPDHRHSSDNNSSKNANSYLQKNLSNKNTDSYEEYNYTDKNRYYSSSHHMGRKEQHPMNHYPQQHSPPQHQVGLNSGIIQGTLIPPGFVYRQGSPNRIVPVQEHSPPKMPPNGNFLPSQAIPMLPGMEEQDYPEDYHQGYHVSPQGISPKMQQGNAQGINSNGDSPSNYRPFGTHFGPHILNRYGGIGDYYTPQANQFRSRMQANAPPGDISARNTQPKNPEKAHGKTVKTTNLGFSSLAEEVVKMHEPLVVGQYTEENN